MKSWCYRYGCFLFGVILNSFGIALITKAALGTSPISSLPYVLSFEFPITLGGFTFIMNTLFVLGQILLLRRNFQWIQLLQMGVNVVFSSCIDVSMNLMSWFQPTIWWEQLLALLLGCTILALGISIEVAPNVLVVPGEGIVKAISTVIHKRFGSVKIAFDVTLVGIATTLSFLFFSQLKGLGVGTIISALIVGKIVNLFNRHLPIISRISGLCRQEA